MRQSCLLILLVICLLLLVMLSLSAGAVPVSFRESWQALFLLIPVCRRTVPLSVMPGYREPLPVLRRGLLWDLPAHYCRH